MPLGTEVGLSQGDIVLDGDPTSPHPHGKGHTFRPMSIVAKRLDGSGFRMPLGTEIGFGPTNIVLNGDPHPSWKGAQLPSPHFLAHFAVAQSSIAATAELL